MLVEYMWSNQIIKLQKSVFLAFSQFLQFFVVYLKTVKTCNMSIQFNAE